MSFAMLSAFSLICMDVQAAAQPLPAAPIASVRVAEAQVETATAAPDLTSAPEMRDEGALETVGSASANDDAALEGPVVFENETDAAVVQKLAEYLETTESLTGDFTQIAPSGAISTGRFYLRRPGFLRFEYDAPTPLLIVANGGMVYVRDEALETTDSYPVGKTPLKFLLGKKLDLNDANIVNVDRGVNNAAVTIASKDDETEGELTIIMRAPEISLRRWIVRDLQNGITVVTLENVKAGEKLANRLFRAPEAGGDFLKN